MTGEFISIPTEWVATAGALAVFVGVIWVICRKPKWEPPQPAVNGQDALMWPKRVEHRVTLSINVSLQPEKVWSDIFRDFKFKDIFKEFDFPNKTQEKVGSQSQ
jgi:hypothetical protein